MIRNSKKKAAAAALIFLSVSMHMAAMGIGFQLNINPTILPGYKNTIATGAACSIKFDSCPLYFAFSTDFDPYASSFNLTAAGDYWIKNPKIMDNWNWFWGIGAAAGTAFFGGNIGIDIAPRALAGMNWKFCDGFMELYVQQAVQIGMRIVFGPDSSVRIPVSFPSNAGIRFWF